MRVLLPGAPVWKRARALTFRTPFCRALLYPARGVRLGRCPGPSRMFEGREEPTVGITRKVRRDRGDERAQVAPRQQENGEVQTQQK